MKYTRKFKEILSKLNEIDDEECQALKDEINELADIYLQKETRLEKIIKLSDKQQKAILELNEELDDYKSNLEQKVQEEIVKRQKQEALLLEQTRLAALSEMINAVAHQWVQPLNVICMRTEVLIIEAKKNNGLAPTKVQEFKKNIFIQVNHLIETLHNFRNFFQPIKGVHTFTIVHALESVLQLLHDDLSKHAIEIQFNKESKFSLTGNENEFKHIFINLINNSKYAFLENKIQNRKIVIELFPDENKIEYSDNAGGIDEKILPSLFEIRSSTKGENGTGMGLYMSQQIAHKHNGKLIATNIENGAKFTFIYKG